MKHLAIDLTIVIIFLIAICTVGKAATPQPSNQCYATCRQFESALLVGCYLADFEGRSEPDMPKRLKNFDRHEGYCRNLVKELMGKDSGCSK